MDTPATDELVRCIETQERLVSDLVQHTQDTLDALDDLHIPLSNHRWERVKRLRKRLKEWLVRNRPV